MRSIIRGIIIGVILVLPGMSGGTVFAIFGMYEKFIKDISRLNLKPYITLLLGIITGIFLGGLIFRFAFYYYQNIALAFLLGCLLASIRPILKGHSLLDVKPIIYFVFSLIIGFYMAGEPIIIGSESNDISYLFLILAGILSSTTMIIPGLPGSGVLVIMGIYEDILIYIGELQIIRLLIFGISGLLGILFFAKALDNIYEKNKKSIAFIFSGLIVGSSRALMPSEINILLVLIFFAGFSAVFISSNRFS